MYFIVEKNHLDDSITNEDVKSFKRFYNSRLTDVILNFETRIKPRSEGFFTFHWL